MLGGHVSKRSAMGALLSLVLVGELTVGAHNGLFTPGGIIVMALLYLSYFNLIDSLSRHYRLSNFGIVLVNFAIYSVLITGLLHGELSVLKTHPEDTLITILIRVQSALTPIFTFSIIRNVKPPQRTASVKSTLTIFAAFVLLMSFSESFGLRKGIDTFATAPWTVILFVVAALFAYRYGLRHKAAAPHAQKLTLFCFVLLGTACITNVIGLLLLILMTIVAGIYCLLRKNIRLAQVSPSANRP